MYSSIITALATRKVYEIAIGVQTVNILVNQAYTPTLVGLNSSADLSGALETLEEDARLFKSLHLGVYSGFRAFKRLPTAFGIRGTW